MNGPLPDVGYVSLLNFEEFLGNLVPVIFVLAFVFFLWGLAKFILHSGEEEAKEEGKRIMFWGIVGLVIMFGIWGIVYFLLDVLFGSGPFQGSNQTIEIPNFPTRVP
ncbi:MAG: hypothetical protein AAB534_00585 [Patescibacteria group bacterium]